MIHRVDSLHAQKHYTLSVSLFWPGHLYGLSTLQALGGFAEQDPENPKTQVAKSDN